MPRRISLADLIHGNWKKIPCSLSDIDLSTLLSCGQTFSWKKIDDSSKGASHVWLNSFNCTALAIRQEDAGLYWTVVADTSQEDMDKMEERLNDYLNLSVSLPDMYQLWSEKDPRFAALQGSFCGIRMLRQDPVENLFSFICSSNNHISRIGGMVHNLAKHYGKHLVSVDNVDIYTFPTAADLCNSEETLRRLGFGYRSKFISATARILYTERPSKFLHSLRERTYHQCVEQLMKFTGVGRKVADCVCLMSLDKHHVVPVDTHVLQIAIRDYKVPGLKNIKSLTPAIHDKIGTYFADLYGPYAGWAHTVLFTADLAKFQDRNPQKRKKGEDGADETENGDSHKERTEKEKITPQIKSASQVEAATQPKAKMRKNTAHSEPQIIRRSNRNVGKSKLHTPDLMQ